MNSTPLNIVIAILLLATGQALGQDVSIFNHGFEDTPRMGTIYGGGVHTRSVDGWKDCGLYRFPGETPPDIHPNNFWNNTLEPFSGRTYVGLVVRENDSWESISQRLDIPLLKGQCYSFSIHLARSENYWSRGRDIDNKIKKDTVNFTNPCVFKLWGGKNSFCESTELLAESIPIENGDWQKFEFKIEPSQEINYILIEAFYETPVWFLYDGHILIDEASDFTQISCDDDEPLVAEVEKPKPKKQVVKDEPVVVVEEVFVEEKPAYVKPNILIELRDPERLETGQKIRIKNLYFQADTSNISKSSFSVLNELSSFLRTNENFVIEVGGHTNDVPPGYYCDSLSTVRALKVAEFLMDKGARKDQIEFKGYGKRYPIASNETSVGRARNQRVEIKILKK